MRVIAQIPPTPDDDDKFGPDHPYLRPHVFIEEAPILKPEDPSRDADEQSDLDHSREEETMN